MFGGVCVYLSSCVAVVVGLLCFVCFLCVHFLISTGSFIDFSNKFISKFLLQHQHGIGSDGACIITHSRQNETTAMRNKMCKFVFNANWKVFCFPLCVSSRLHLYVDLLAIFFFISFIPTKSSIAALVVKPTINYSSPQTCTPPNQMYMRE